MCNTQAHRKRKIGFLFLSLTVVLMLLASVSPLQVIADSDAVEVVTNGSFETGDFTGWATQAAGYPLVPWTVSGAGTGSGYGLATTSPQDGARVAWNGFDGATPMEFIMWQDVTLPAGVATLSWMERIQWDFTLGNTASQPRTFEVQIRDPGTNAVLSTVFGFSTGTQAENPTGDTGWQGHSVDVSDFAGSSVRLYCVENIPQPSTGPGQFEIDAVSLLVITNQPPDVSQAYADPGCLWPPDHDFVSVSIMGVTDPDPDDTVTINITGITSDEPTALGLGSGGEKHAPDADGVGTDTALLRAERSGNGDGRVYVIEFTATDSSGGTSSGSVEVKVPHDQSDKEECLAIDSGQVYDATQVMGPGEGYPFVTGGTSSALDSSPVTYIGELVDFTTGEVAWDSVLTPASWSYYSFCGEQGDQIAIEVHRLVAANDPAMTLFFGTTDDSEGLHPLYSNQPGMVWVAFADDELCPPPHGVGGPFCDPRMALTLPETGTYTLAVFTFGWSSDPPMAPYDIHTWGISPCNQPPDVSNAAPSISAIWPPNHKFIPINILGVTDPDGDDVTITITSIMQDEPVDTFGDGNFVPDGKGVGTDTAEVRAERSGTQKVPGNGRVYTIGFTASDGKGGECSGTVKVGVPHDVKDTPVDDGALYDSTALE